MKRGKLIAFEGLDGSGKSTQLEQLATALRDAGHPVVSTREPGDGAAGQRIRAMARSGERISAQQELDWFLEDRREHVGQVVEPALARGQLVLTDRYTLSSVAYQGARGLDFQQILEQGEREFPLPDLAILLEIAPALGLERVERRGGVTEPAFEEAGFLARVAEIFACLDRSYIVRLDGSGEPALVHGRVRACVGERLGLR